MIGVVLFVGALTITWVRISGVYMRNNKLAGSDRPNRQSEPCSMLLMLPHDSTAIMLYRGGHDVWCGAGPLTRFITETMDSWAPSLDRCHAALAYSGSRVCIIVSNDAGAPRRVLCNSEQSYRLAWSRIGKTRDDRWAIEAITPGNWITNSRWRK